MVYYSTVFDLPYHIMHGKCHIYLFIFHLCYLFMLFIHFIHLSVYLFKAEKMMKYNSLKHITENVADGCRKIHTILLIRLPKIKEQ